MKVAINDLSFQYPFYDWHTADIALHNFLELCKEIKRKRYRCVEGIWGDVINCEYEIAPGHTLIKLIQNFQPREERSLLLSFLSNSSCIFSEIPFCLDGKESCVCAFAKDGAVISLNSQSLFSGSTLDGKLGGMPCEIRNIAQSLHITLYNAVLGRRIYERNPKHPNKNPYTRGNMIVSPMDLSNEEAQEALDRAVEVNGQLFSKKGDSYYTFRRHQGDLFHGYRNDQLTTDLKKRIDREIAQMEKEVI